MTRTKWTVLIGALVALFLIHPIGRAILIFLWPIDPGHEDTIVFLILVAFGWFFFIHVPKLRKGE